MNYTVSEAEALYQKLDRQRELTNRALENCGQCKLRALTQVDQWKSESLRPEQTARSTSVVADFIETYERLKNVDLALKPELDKLAEGDFLNKTLPDLRKSYQAVQEYLGDSDKLGPDIPGDSFEAALGFGAYNGTTLLAGHWIDVMNAFNGLSALLNATLSWLGMGFTAGTPEQGLFGGRVDDITLTIVQASFTFDSRRRETLEACRNLQPICEQFNVWADKLKAIRPVAKLACATFSEISLRLSQAVDDLKQVIERDGEEFSHYSGESKEVVFRSVKFAQLLKALFDTPILNEDGELVSPTAKRIEGIALAEGIALVGNEESDEDEPDKGGFKFDKERFFKLLDSLSNGVQKEMASLLEVMQETLQSRHKLGAWIENKTLASLAKLETQLWKMCKEARGSFAELVERLESILNDDTLSNEGKQILAQNAVLMEKNHFWQLKSLIWLRFEIADETSNLESEISDLKDAISEKDDDDTQVGEPLTL
jgi:hypothetical protein